MFVICLSCTCALLANIFNVLAKQQSICLSINQSINQSTKLEKAAIFNSVLITVPEQQLCPVPELVLHGTFVICVALSFDNYCSDIDAVSGTR